MKKYIMSYQEHIQLLSEQKKQSENQNKEEDTLSSIDIPRTYRGSPSTGKIDDTPLRQGEQPVLKNKDIDSEKSKKSNKPLL